MKCEACDNLVYKKVVEDAHQVCPECGFHFRINAKQRIEYLLDPDSFTVLFDNLESIDALNFKGQKSYKDKLAKAQKNTGLREAAHFGVGAISGQRVVFGVIDPSFIMGSMGSVVGEKIARGAEYARKEGIPLIIVSGSGGGARMEEGILSLFQMAKTSAAIKRLQDAGGVYIAILTNATMGGSMASWASTGRYHDCRAQGSAGLCGPARDCADGAPGTAPGLPDFRVPARARLRGHGRAPQGAAAEADFNPALYSARDAGLCEADDQADRSPRGAQACGQSDALAIVQSSTDAAKAASVVRLGPAPRC
jgi:acetyl-CoA carboxylase carboxyl transferase subunit beta